MGEIGEFQRGWPIVAAATLGIGLGLVPVSMTYTLGLFVQPLSRGFGWSQQAIMSVPLVAAISVVPAMFVVGWCADRVGSRRVILVSQFLLGLCLIALGALSANLWSFYGIFIVMGALGAGTQPVPFARIITAHFFRHRGLALGIALAGSGLCGMLVPSYAALAITRFGWRGAYVCLGLLPLFIAFPIAYFAIREAPGGLPDSTEKPVNQSSGLAGLTLHQALRSWRFGLVALIFFFIAAAVTGPTLSFIPMLMDRGLSRAHAAEFAGVVGISVIAGRLSVGWLIDRFWAPAVGACFFIPSGIAAWALTHAEMGSMATAAAVIGLSLSTGAELDLSAYLVSRYFGLHAYGRLYAVVYMAIAIGGALAGPLFGRVHDRTGSYTDAFAAASFMFLFCGLALLGLGRYPAAFTFRDPDAAYASP